MVLLIVLHGLVAMRNKAAATGRITLQRGEVRLLLWTIVVVFLLILISTLPGEVFLLMSRTGNRNPKASQGT